MRLVNRLSMLLLLAFLCVPALADEAESGWLAAAGEIQTPADLNSPNGTWLAQATKPKGPATVVKEEKVAKVQEPAKKGPPLPLHTIEGAGGTLTVPVAYLINPGPDGSITRGPAVSYTYIDTGHQKNLMVAAVSQSFFQRFEVSYALGRFYLGTLPHVIRKVSGGALHIRDEVWLNQFRGTAVIIKENEFGSWCPQVTASAIFKYNQGIDNLDKELQPIGGLRASGYRRHYGVDYTLTLSKMVVMPLIERPFIFTVGGRNSSASNTGYTGFTDNAVFSVEGSIICMVTDKLAAFYEFRQKANPYSRVPGVVGDEGNWHGAALAYIVSPNLVIAAAYGRMGEVGNTDVDGAWGFQIKYEF